jgi:antitoxin ParD1/3/4
MPSSYTLGEHFEGLVRELVDSGRYSSASEVMRDGLRLLEERESLRDAKLAALRRDIAEGLQSGASEDHDMGAILAEAKAERQATKKRAARGA